MSIGKPKLKHLCNYVVRKVAVKWKVLGIQLDVDKDTLDIIKRDNSHSCEDCCREMFEKWLETKAEPTWNKLIKALMTPACELESVANMIKQSVLITKGKVLHYRVMSHYPAQTQSDDTMQYHISTLTMCLKVFEIHVHAYSNCLSISNTVWQELLTKEKFDESMVFSIDKLTKTDCLIDFY